MTEIDILKAMEKQAEEKVASMRQSLELQEKYATDLQTRRCEAEKQKGKSGASGTVNGAVTVTPSAMPPAMVGGQLGENLSLVDKIVKIFRESGRDMQGKEITKILIARGEKGDGKKGISPNVLSTLNRRNDLFENVTRGVYRLKKKE